MKSEISDLKNMMQAMFLGQTPKQCGICWAITHATDACPTLQTEDVSAIGFGQNSNRPFQGNSYNETWRNHPNLSYGNQQAGQKFQQVQPGQYQGFGGMPRPPFAPPQQQVQVDKSGEILQVLSQNLVALSGNFQQHQQETKSSITNIERQISQMADDIGRIKARDSTKLPSRTEENPRANVSAITLRSGKELEERVVPSSEPVVESGAVEPETVVETEKPIEKAQDKRSTPEPFVYEPIPPFPEALKESRKPESDKEIFDVFKRLEVNLPFLKLIQSVPRYAKFLKELCTTKREQKLRSQKKPKLVEQVSAVFQRQYAQKVW